jgi:hypothetical protein
MAVNQPLKDLNLPWLRIPPLSFPSIPGHVPALVRTFGLLATSVARLLPLFKSTILVMSPLSSILTLPLHSPSFEEIRHAPDNFRAERYLDLR